MEPIFFAPCDTFSKGILILLHPGFDDVTDVDTDPKGRFVSFKVAPSNDRVLCIYAPSGHSNREQLVRGRFFEGLQNYIENKTEGNENKIIIGDFNCTLDKKDRDEGNKTQKRYRCHSNCALSKIVMDNGLEDFWRRENPETSEFTCCDRSSGTRSRINRVYTDKKIANNTKITHKMISFSDHYNALIINRFSSKTKTGKDLWHFNNSLLEKTAFCSNTQNLLTFLKTKRINYSSTSDWWEFTKCKIKDNARTFSKNSTKQENIRISKFKKRLRNLHKKENYKRKIKPMINTFQGELYLLETKEAKGARIPANIRWDLDGERCSKIFFKVLERQNMQNQTNQNFALINKNQNIAAILMKYLNLQKAFMKTFTLEKMFPKLP